MTTRNKNNFYRTAEALTRVLLAEVSIKGTVYECCAGDLAIANFFPDCITNDVDPTMPTHTHRDATQEESWVFPSADWVVTNPPFNATHRILPLAYESARVGVAFLLRLSYLEPCEDRADWLAAHEDNLDRLIIFGQSRPSFTGNGRTDNVTTAWMVWTKNCPKTKVTFRPHWNKL